MEMTVLGLKKYTGCGIHRNTSLLNSSKAFKTTEIQTKELSLWSALIMSKPYFSYPFEREAKNNTVHEINMPSEFFWGNV